MFNDLEKKIELEKERQFYLIDIGKMVNFYNNNFYNNKKLIEDIIKGLGRISLLIKKQIKKIDK